MVLDVHIDQLHHWGRRLRGTDLGDAARRLDLAASPPGWDTTHALSAWAASIEATLRELSADLDTLGTKITACARNYEAVS
jgi:hypothetical protein